MQPPGEESDFLARLKARDSQATEELVRRHSGPLLAVARGLLSNEDDARDALQDAFLSAFRSIDQFDGRARLGTWLHRIAVNAALMKLRSRKRRPVASIEGLLPRFTDDEHQADPPAPWSEGDDDPVVREERRDLVRRCIDQLPEIYRTVLLLRDIEELDTEETAKLVGASSAVVKTRLHRARQALRTLLDPHVRGGTA